MIDWPALARRLERLARGAPPGSVLSLTVPLPAMPAGLPAGDEWIAWQRPGQGQRLLGIGAALCVETEGPGRFAALGAAARGLAERSLEDVPGVSPRLSFAGFAFAPEGGAPLPNAMLTLPAVLLREAGGHADASFSCVAADAAGAVARWRHLLRFRRLWGFAPSLAPLGTATCGASPHPSRCSGPPLRGVLRPSGWSWRPAPFGLVSRGNTPRLTRRPAPLADLAFLARGGAALAAIASGACEKLVLTRSVRLAADRAIDPGAVLEALAAQNPACAVWAVARQGRVFLGASPERLLGFGAGVAEVDALAGTAWTAPSADRPASLPLSGEKNRREHELVVASVREALAPLCDGVTVPDEPEVMRVHGLSHLRRRIVGQARPGVGAFDLIARLHPTPAVGGTPTAAALDWLAAHGDRRGAWYTGGIGWIDAAGDADFAVALRCGLISGHEATLWAGAGFVAGSEPRQELAETEAKLSPMLAALRTRPVAGRATGS